MEPESNPLDLLRQRRAINRVEAAMRKTEEAPKPGGYRYLGRNADTGQGLVAGNDGSVIPGDIITSGHVKPGQAVRVAQAGGLVQLDQKPRVRKVVPPVVKKEDGGPVKILFSVAEGAERIYYVGGDRRTPKELFRVSGDIEEPHIVATGKGLNQFYWQYWTLYPLLPIGEQFARIIDSRVGDPINTPPLYELRNTQTAGLGQLYRTLQYEPIKYVGNGLITGFIYNSIDNPPGSTVRTSVLSFRGIEIDRGTVRISTTGSGTGSRADISGTPFTSYSGSVSYEFLATGNVPYFSGGGAEGGQTSSIGAIPGTYTANMSRRTLIHVGTSASLMQLIEYQESGGVVSYKDRTISKVSGAERELSTEVKDLISDNWIGPAYSSIVGSTLWVIDPQLSTLRTQLNNDQSFIDFKAVDLSSDGISNKRVKIFPISQTIDQIHSISYHP